MHLLRKHEHIGFVEFKLIPNKIDDINTMHQVMFLVDLDKTSKKVYATYGPFFNKEEIDEFSSIHNIKVENI